MQGEHTTTGDPLFDLLAAVYRQAIKDTLSGDDDAAAFLRDTWPQWQQEREELRRRARRRARTRLRSWPRRP